ncbi:MAG TPA: 16S rRNA (cytosine(1402)-N(4))-methyltransferase RsmH [Thermoanaerobaculia bacterium]|nr:16S rRNA (cytosine(1402)-N(4))-methyltransferase RsmH [Thermoanaerobaculia bacterium]
MQHQPVLLNEILEYLIPSRPDGTLVDATVGLGGHSEALLEKHPSVRLIGIDRDPEALERSRQRLSRFGDRVTLVQGRHESLIDILKQSGTERAGGVLADLGVSSMQLDDASRGFSFRFDAPLDMRMGSEGKSAADLVNELDEYELTRILRDYGEEPMARRIARAIVHARVEGPIATTTQLAAVIKSVKKQRYGEIDPSTLTFQALRIATNEELVGLDQFADDAVRALETKARVAIISFHSLEDRIVKRAFRRLEGECTCPPNLPVCGCGAKAVIEQLTGRPVTASEEEINSNPRSRSAKLRVAEKL